MKRRRKFPKSIFFLFLLVLGIIIFLVVFLKPASIFLLNTVSMIQYAGGRLNNEPIDRPDVVFSTTAKIDDYKIQTSTVSYLGKTPIYADEIICNTNSCNGKTKAIITISEINRVQSDEFGCPFYFYNTQVMSPSGEQFQNSDGSFTCDQNFCDSCVSNSLPGCTSNYPSNCCSISSVEQQCGGRKVEGYQEGSGCWAKFDISKQSGNLIKSIPYTKVGHIETSDRQKICQQEVIRTTSTSGVVTDTIIKGQYCSLTCSEGFLLTSNSYQGLSTNSRITDFYCVNPAIIYYRDSNKLLTEAGLKINLYTNSLFQYGNCIRIDNTFVYNIPEDSFTFNVTLPENQVFTDQLVQAVIKINNTFKNVVGNLIVKYEIPTAIGSATKTVERVITIPTGINSYAYDIPTTQVTDKIIITPQLDILMEGTKFEGVNGICYKQTSNTVTNLRNCNYILLATLYGDIFDVSILPKEILELQRLEGDITTLSMRIKALTTNIEETADIIRQLELTASEQAQVVSNLQLTISDQAKLITLLETKASEQAVLIGNLKLSVDKQANLINALNLEISNQLIIINNLDINLKLKEEIVKKLDITNAQQEIMIAQLRGSFAEQASYIDSLKLTVEDDAKLINQYSLSLEGQGKIIKNLDLTVLEQAKTISILTKNIDDMTIIIDNLNLNVNQLVELIDNLKLSDSESKILIDKLNLNIEQKQKLIESLSVVKKPQISYPFAFFISIFGTLVITLFIFLIYLLTKKRKR